jgi:hypothetical protein
MNAFYSGSILISKCELLPVGNFSPQKKIKDIGDLKMGFLGTHLAFFPGWRMNEASRHNIIRVFGFLPAVP